MSNIQLKKLFYRATYLLAFLLANTASFATECTGIFPGALQTHSPSPNGKITFNQASKVISNPSTTLYTTSINNKVASNLSCNTAVCLASGTPAATMDVGNFQYNENGANVNLGQGSTYTFGGSGVTDYGTISVGQGSTITFPSPDAGNAYRIKSLSVGQGGTINLGTGDYWIETFSVNQGSTINITGDGTARLMVLNSVTINQGSMNNSSAANAAKSLFIYAYNDFTLKQGNNFKGFIYSDGNVTLNQGNVEVGAINAKNITLNQGTQITYDSAAASGLDLNSACNFTPTITHFVIENNNDGNYCIPSPITVTAYNGDSIATDFNGIVKLDTGTGTGTWSLDTGNGTLNDTVSNDGIAYYTFSPQDQGVATFYLLYTNGDSNINLSAQLRYNNNIHDNGSAGALNISSNTFLLTNAPIPNPAPPIRDIVSYADTQTAGVATPIYITAFGTKEDLSCGTITTYTGVKSVQFWQNYVSPSSGTLTTMVDTTNVGASEGSAVAIDLTFTDGSASFNTLYRDVGMIALLAKDTTNNISGSSSNYVVKPAKLVVTSIPNNPGATDENSGIFVAAGSAFTAEVTVQDYDGNTTPNYGNELIPAGIKLVASTLVAPQGGRNGAFNDGTIGNNTAFSKTAPGVFQGTTFYYDEVGIIKLTAEVADGNYIGVGNVTGPESDNVGRFIPHHFEATANVPIINTGCSSGGFSYLGQPLTYNVEPSVSITAQSEQNSTTQNYQGSYWKMTTNNLAVAYSSNSATATLNSTAAAAAITLTSNNNGTGTIQLGDGGGLTFNKVNGSNIANFTAEISAGVTIQDADGVTYTSNPYTIGSTLPNTGIAFSGGNSILQGRISLNNNFGSELLPLTIPVKIEYFNGTNYVTNTNDSCTSISNANFVSTTATPESLTTTATLGNFAAGVGSISLSAPNVTGNVDVSIDLSAANLTYLQHDWPQNGSDGSFTDNPVAKATFGIFHGNDKAVYSKEVLD